MKPSPTFLHRLDQLQVQAQHAVASTGIGERRSRAKGMGTDFADYRPYVPGDDTRHLDARLHARLGDFFVREYEVLKQLPVSIFIDGSRSMLQGTPSKLDAARWLAGALGYVALASSDLSQIGFWSGRRFFLSPEWRGVRRIGRMLDWIEELPADGTRSFEPGLDEFASKLRRGSLVAVLSDFWMEDPVRPLRSLAASGAEIWAFQVLTPGEIDPNHIAQGETRFIDDESGEEVLLTLDREVLGAYREVMAARQVALTELISSTGGQHVLVSTADDLEKLFIGLRIKGLFR